MNKISQIKVVAMIIVLLGSVLYVLMWSNGHNWGDDFAGYILQAISLADGNTSEYYRNNSFTIKNSTVLLGPITYPWGFPIFLSPVYKIFGIDFIAFKAVGLVFYIGFLLVLWYGFNSRLTPSERLVLISFFAFNPYFLKFGDNVLSDIPYLFFSTSAILVASSFEKFSSLTKQISVLSAFAIFAALATWVRTNGVLIILTYAFIFFSDFLFIWKAHNESVKLTVFINSYCGKFKSIVMAFLPTAVFILIVFPSFVILPNGQESHLGHFSWDSVRSLLGNVKYYFLIFSELFSPSDGGVLGLFIYLLTLIPFAIGVYGYWKRSVFILVYSIFTLMLYIFWPARQGLRFLFPLLPFFVYFTILGTRSIFNVKIRSSYRISYMHVLCVFFFISSTYLAVKNITNGSVVDGPFSDDSIKMFEFVLNNTEPTDVIIFNKPRSLTLFTGRQSLHYRRPSDIMFGDLYAYSKKFGEQFSPSESEFVFKFNPVAVYENDSFIIFRLQ